MAEGPRTDGVHTIEDVTLLAFAEGLATGERGWAGGAAAAYACTMGAAMLAHAARSSARDWAGAGGAAAQATALRRRMLPLLQRGADAYAAASAALQAPSAAAGGDDELGAVLWEAARVPLLIAEGAHDIATLGEAIVREGAADARPDAICSCLLVEAAGRAAVGLVEVNLGTPQGDPRLAEARGIAAALASVRANVLRAAPG